LLRQLPREDTRRSFTTQRGGRVASASFEEFVVRQPLKGPRAMMRFSAADSPIRPRPTGPASGTVLAETWASVDAILERRRARKALLRKAAALQNAA